MIVEDLISRYVRHLNQRLMTFESSPDEVQLPAPDTDKQYLLYLHIPFCVVLCPFCSFHRVEFREDKATQYFHALQEEIRLATDRGYRFSEVYVGGGTPTVLPGLLADTLELISSLHPMTSVSVETNPHDLDASNTIRLKQAGVNRLSVGVQSFDDRLLREMERYEKYGSSKEISAHLKDVSGKFDTLNIDMIFNFPHQDEACIQSDLNVLTDRIKVDQVSWYPLMTSTSSRRLMEHAMGTVDHSREQGFYELIVGHMRDAGYQRSSAWCFSRRPGLFDEYIVEHEEYLGLGSGSFSYLNGSMFANTFSINNYLRRIDSGKTGVVRQRVMSVLEQMRYYLLMQLFSGKMNRDLAEKRFEGQFDRVMWRDLAGLRVIGAVKEQDGRICLTESGYYLWVVLMREFFAGVNNFRDDMRHNISRESVGRSGHFG